MSPDVQYNCDLSARLADLITTTSINSVMEQQPVRWRPATWQNHWRMNKLPYPHVLDELQEEYAAHDKIRRSFVFTYQGRSPVELFIAAMAWGLGPDNRGPAKIGAILTRSNDAAKAIEAVVNIVCQEGAVSGYRKYFLDHRIANLGPAFITKLLYFAGYNRQNPRPVIYDSLVATAVIRLPEAPLLAPSTEINSKSYGRYCRWAEKTAADYGTEPAVVEWALFCLGEQIRDELRA